MIASDTRTPKAYPANSGGIPLSFLVLGIEEPRCPRRKTAVFEVRVTDSESETRALRYVL